MRLQATLPTVFILLPIFALGAVAGSFVALIADRWPRGEAIAVARSRCIACRRTLGAAELVPIFSFLLQRGRCAGCGAPISTDLLAAEIIGGGQATLAFAATSNPAQFVALASFAWALLLLGLLDIRHFWLPDKVTLPLVAAGLASSLLMPDLALGDRIAGTCAGFLSLEAIRFGFRTLRGHDGMGGGDAKLLAAIGAWLGWTCLPFVVLAAALMGMAWAAFAAIHRKADMTTLRVPLGAALAAAASLAMPFVA
jgi:leader peptidase (prepilin peptidase)/N-methyltransferase